MNLITRGHAVAGSLTVQEDLVVGGTFSSVGVVEDGVLSVDSIEAAGEITAAEVTALGVEFTIGAEDSDVINVAIQINDGHGDPVEVSKALHIYLAEDDAGLEPSATDPDGGVEIGTDGALIALSLEPFLGLLISDGAGAADLDIEESGAGTWYLVVVLPNGSLAISNAITFAGA